MDQASPVSPAASRSDTTPRRSRPGIPAEAFSPSGSEAEASGEPDSPGPRSTLSLHSPSRSGTGRHSDAVQVFDEPLNLLGGCLLGVLTLMVPLAGVVTDRNLLSGRAASGATPGPVAEQPAFRPAAAAEIPENPGPGKRAPDR